MQGAPFNLRLSGDFPDTLQDGGPARRETMIPFTVAALSCVIWIYLIAARGNFWHVPNFSILRDFRTAGMQARVAIVVPARNEADVIAQPIQSLLAQDYPGPLHIYVVDDQSSDHTANVVREAAAGHHERLCLLSSSPLPQGWSGKMWALSQGVQHASDFAPDYLLFTDADIVHGPDSVSSLVALADAGNRDLVSMMVKLRCDSFAERALIPAFVFFFFMLYPPIWVNSPKRKTAAAAGGVVLVRADALARIGGIAAIRHELIDDCALAREIKLAGNIFLGLTENARSIRPYGSFGVIGRMISRSAFYQLRHSAWFLLGTILGLAITYLAPPVLVFAGDWTTLFAAASWILMTIAFLPMVRFYSLSPLWAPMLPLIAMFYAAATIHSAIQYWLGRGGEWKDRVQDARQKRESQI
jgi:hopene-associated glycosyltransferase HpnB